VSASETSLMKAVAWATMFTSHVVIIFHSISAVAGFPDSYKLPRCFRTHAFLTTCVVNLDPGRINIILADPDPHPFQPIVKFN
jgi:hypothetical protein